MKLPDASWVLLRMSGLVGIGLLMVSILSAAQTTESVKRAVIQKDFRIFDYYKTSPRLKTLLLGAEAEYLSHPIPIRNMTIETYTEVGQTNWIARAKSCFCDRTNRTAYSSGPIDFRLADGRFSLSGTGFLWSQTNTSLIVSNRVRSVLRGDILQNDPTHP